MEEMVVRTVLGDIDPDDLGLTDAHEHLMADMGDLVEAQRIYKEMMGEDMLEPRPENLAFLRTGTGLFSDGCSAHNDLDWLVGELGFFRDKVGGGCVVDASSIGMRADARLLRQASRDTGVHIVCTTGLYYEAGRPEEYRSFTESQVYDLCAAEVRDGIAGSEDEDGVRVFPGFLKCAMSSEGEGSQIPACELDTLRALARLAGETGLSLHVHTGKPMTSSQVISVAEEALKAGCPPSRLNMMHLDQYLRDPDNLDEYIRDMGRGRNIDLALQRTILQMGCYIGFDSWGMTVVVVPDNADRTKGLVQLLAEGYADQIVLGHDIYEKSRSCAMGGWGFSDFSLNLIPKLYEFADIVDMDDIGKLIYDNPARLLAFDPKGV